MAITHDTSIHSDHISRSQDGSILQVSATNAASFEAKEKMVKFITLLQNHPELAGHFHRASDINNALDQEVTRAYEMSAGHIHPERKITESELVNYLVDKKANPRVIDRLATAYILEFKLREDDKHNFGFTHEEAGKDAQGRVAEILSHGETVSPTLNEVIRPSADQKNSMINYLKENAEKHTPDPDPLDTYKQDLKHESDFSR
ncbi:MAG: hypothetical protein WBL28_04230 [Methylotenera sp.]